MRRPCAVGQHGRKDNRNREQASRTIPTTRRKVYDGNDSDSDGQAYDDLGRTAGLCCRRWAAVLRQLQYTRRPNDAETVALFAGFLYCGDCGSRLVRRSASYKGKRYIYYQCSGSKQNKGSCTSHNLRDEKLYNIVRNALQMQIQIVMEEAEFVESIRQAQQEPYRVRRIERQIRQLTAEKAHTQGIKEKLYGDYADEILTREDFLNYNELYSKRIEEYSHKITELEAERQNLQTAPNAYPFLDVYRKYRKLEEITRPMVVELIEKIEVYEGNRVEITFRFHDEIADLLEELHQKQMG